MISVASRHSRFSRRNKIIGGRMYYSTENLRYNSYINAGNQIVTGTRYYGGGGKSRTRRVLKRRKQ